MQHPPSTIIALSGFKFNLFTIRKFKKTLLSYINFMLNTIPAINYI